VRDVGSHRTNGTKRAGSRNDQAAHLGDALDQSAGANRRERREGDDELRHRRIPVGAVAGIGLLEDLRESLRDIRARDADGSRGTGEDLGAELG
jgi:hypothetical protein